MGDAVEADNLNINIEFYLRMNHEYQIEDVHNSWKMHKWLWIRDEILSICSLSISMNLDDYSDNFEWIW